MARYYSSQFSCSILSLQPASHRALTGKRNHYLKMSAQYVNLDWRQAPSSSDTVNAIERFLTDLDANSKARITLSETRGKSHVGLVGTQPPMVSRLWVPLKFFPLLLRPATLQCSQFCGIISKHGTCHGSREYSAELIEHYIMHDQWLLMTPLFPKYPRLQPPAAKSSRRHLVVSVLSYQLLGVFPIDGQAFKMLVLGSPIIQRIANNECLQVLRRDVTTLRKYKGQVLYWARIYSMAVTISELLMQKQQVMARFIEYKEVSLSHLPESNATRLGFYEAIPRKHRHSYIHSSSLPSIP